MYSGPYNSFQGLVCHASGGIDAILVHPNTTDTMRRGFEFLQQTELGTRTRLPFGPPQRARVIAFPTSAHVHMP